MADKVLDKHVRKSLHEYLRKASGEASKPDAVLIDELVVQRKNGRVDVAVVNAHLHCYEIKSDADTLTRLQRQVRVYGKVFDYLNVVVTDKHLALARAAVPSFWGIHVWFPKSVLFNRPDEVLLVQNPELNPEVDAASLTQLLWKPTALELLRTQNAEKGWLTKPKWAVWRRVQDVCTVQQIHDAVCVQYKTHRRLERAS